MCLNITDPHSPLFTTIHYHRLQIRGPDKRPQKFIVWVTWYQFSNLVRDLLFKFNKHYSLPSRVLAISKWHNNSFVKYVLNFYIVLQHDTGNNHTTRQTLSGAGCGSYFSEWCHWRNVPSLLTHFLVLSIADVWPICQKACQIHQTCARWKFIESFGKNGALYNAKPRRW